MARVSAAAPNVASGSRSSITRAIIRLSALFLLTSMSSADQDGGGATDLSLSRSSPAATVAARKASRFACAASSPAWWNAALSLRLEALKEFLANAVWLDLLKQEHDGGLRPPGPLETPCHFLWRLELRL
jgi:hypothetical protein